MVTSTRQSRKIAGLLNSRRARWKHGAYSAAALERYRKMKAEAAAFSALSAMRYGALMGAARVMSREQAREVRNLRRRRKRAKPS